MAKAASEDYRQREGEMVQGTVVTVGRGRAVQVGWNTHQLDPAVESSRFKLLESTSPFKVLVSTVNLHPCSAGARSSSGLTTAPWWGAGCKRRPQA